MASVETVKALCAQYRAFAVTLKNTRAIVDKIRLSKVKDAFKAELTLVITKKDIRSLVKCESDKEELDIGKED